MCAQKKTRGTHSLMFSRPRILVAPQTLGNFFLSNNDALGRSLPHTHTHTHTHTRARALPDSRVLFFKVARRSRQSGADSPDKTLNFFFWYQTFPNPDVCVCVCVCVAVCVCVDGVCEREPRPESRERHRRRVASTSSPIAPASPGHGSHSRGLGSHADALFTGILPHVFLLAHFVLVLARFVFADVSFPVHSRASSVVCSRNASAAPFIGP